MIGRTIGHYRILEELGRGGMGVVYKAQDTNLERFVALKFLPPDLSTSDVERARFLQEAKAVGSLSHPNICTIYGIEEEAGQSFIVMEFVEGKTLKELQKNIPMKQAVEIGIQVADGLAAAHEKGIVHRDIKPDNIMIRKDGRVQIMDFGLAKFKGVSTLTKAGSTVGTVGYMSPEQIQGQETDHRTDIFSLGVVLYELFSGDPPFRGYHETAITYEIVNVDPTSLSVLKPEISPELDAIVLECLEKEPSERYQSVAEVGKDLRRFKRESGRHAQSHTMPAAAVRRPSTLSADTTGRGNSRAVRFLPWLLAGICIAGVVVFAFVFKGFTSAERTTIRAFLPLSGKFAFSMYGIDSGPAVLSPDGRHLAFDASDSTGKPYLFVWDLDAPSPRRLEGTEGALYPFWSPNSQFLGFFVQGKLERIDASGGAPIMICDARNARGGTWNAEDMIIFTPSPGDPLFLVPASGGAPIPITKLDLSQNVNSHRWPWFLPDGKHFLYYSRTTVSGGSNEGDAICVGSTDGKETRVLVHASSNAQYASGYLLYTRDNALVAQSFDPGSLELKGDSFTIAEGVAFDDWTIHSLFTASQNGILIYQTGNAHLDSRLVFLNRNGTPDRIIGDRVEFLQPRISPDGEQVATDAYDLRTHNIDIWIYGAQHNNKTRFTFAPGSEQYPTWSPDGRQVYFMANPGGTADLYQKSSSGAGHDQLVLRTPGDKIPLDMSHDGKYLLYQMFGGPRSRWDLWIMPVVSAQNDSAHRSYPYLQSEFNETDGRFSPDGRWIAYTSDESGQNEVYVGTSAAAGGRWQVSTSGGRGPRWRQDGKEIYYLSPENKIMAASIASDNGSIAVSNIHPLFAVPLIVSRILPSYDVSPDGNRFLVNMQSENQDQTPLSLCVNWDAALGRR